MCNWEGGLAYNNLCIVIHVRACSYGRNHPFDGSLFLRVVAPTHWKTVLIQAAADRWRINLGSTKCTDCGTPLK